MDLALHHDIRLDEYVLQSACLPLPMTATRAATISKTAVVDRWQSISVNQLQYIAEDIFIESYIDHGQQFKFNTIDGHKYEVDFFPLETKQQTSKLMIKRNSLMAMRYDLYHHPYTDVTFIFRQIKFNKRHVVLYATHDTGTQQPNRTIVVDIVAMRVVFDEGVIMPDNQLVASWMNKLYSHRSIHAKTHLNCLDFDTKKSTSLDLQMKPHTGMVQIISILYVADIDTLKMVDLQHISLVKSLQFFHSNHNYASTYLCRINDDVLVMQKMLDAITTRHECWFMLISKKARILDIKQIKHDGMVAPGNRSIQHSCFGPRETLTRLFTVKACDFILVQSFDVRYDRMNLIASIKKRLIRTRIDLCNEDKYGLIFMSSFKCHNKWQIIASVRCSSYMNKINCMATNIKLKI